MKEENQIDSKFIDSSLLIAFIIDGRGKEIISKPDIFLISVLSLFEVHKKLLQFNINEDKISNYLNFIKRKSVVINVDEKVAVKAVEFSHKNDLPAIDSLIYASAVLNNATLFTLDNDFRGLKNVIVMEVR